MITGGGGVRLGLGFSGDGSGGFDCGVGVTGWGVDWSVVVGEVGESAI